MINFILVFIAIFVPLCLCFYLLYILDDQSPDSKIIISNGVNMKIVSKDICCIYGALGSSNYFIKKKDLKKLMRKKWR